MRRPIALVLGAAGFIGRNTSMTLAKNGFNVVGIGRGTWSEPEWRNWGLTRWINGEISQSINHLALQKAPSFIVHCGGSGSVSYSYQKPLDDFFNATSSTAVVLDWIRNNCSKDCKFILVSSAAVYGNQGDVDLSETASKYPISPYGIHKLAAEMLCESYSRFFGVSTAIVRLFSVYGEGLRKQLFWDALNKFRKEEAVFFGTGIETRDWLHINDASKLIELVCKSSESKFEVYNGGGYKATTKFVLEELARCYGYSGRIIFGNEKHNGNPQRLTSNYEHAKDLLGWEPEISLRSGLIKYVDWYKNQIDSAV